MLLYVGTWAPSWGHTWIARGFGKTYALKSLAGGSFLCVDGKAFPTPGEHSCHITLLKKQAVVSDYTSGTLSVFPLREDGMPAGKPLVYRFHEKGSHIHSSWISPEKDRLVVADLGSDCLYRFPVRDGALFTEGMETFPMPPDCGPRHCAFCRGMLYVSTERSDEVLVLEHPSMELRQRIVANPERPGGGGHILPSPDGRFLYMSCRLKNDGIAIFRILENGLLENAGYCRTGMHPRHFCLTPDGTNLLAACRDDHAIQLFNRSAETGSLTFSGQEISVEKPVFVEVYEEN